MFFRPCVRTRRRPRKNEAKKKTLGDCMEWLVLNPLRTLFRLGPTWIGGWGGADLPDICAQLTTSPARFWEMHTDECERIVALKIDSHLVLFTTALYFWVLFSILSLCMRAAVMRWTLGRPLGLLASAVSSGNHIADRWRSPTCPRLQTAAGPPPLLFPDSGTLGTEPKRSERPQ